MNIDLLEQPLAPLLSKAISLNEAYADKFGVELKLSSMGDEVVKVDGQRLQQVLSHLLSNAVKFSPKGAQVELSARQMGDWVRLQVRRSGSAKLNRSNKYILGALRHGKWAVENLSHAFKDPSVGVASGNLLVSNRQRNPITSIQSLEYMLSITIGRGFLNYIGAISCFSGAFTMVLALRSEHLGCHHR